MRGTPPTAAQIREAVALLVEGDRLLRLLGVEQRIYEARVVVPHLRSSPSASCFGLSR
jgi:hypothetical protein